ncbi:MAG TPA: hypothetical protein PLR18_04615 [bacterium]|mgnify:CR=1 FL=1|nr:hypothetical protein [bacterium]
MPEYLNNTEKNWPTKAMFGVLVFLGMATLILGTLQLGKNINIGGNNNTSNSATTGEEETELTITQLKNNDTDQDGLSDFDELYVYSTSPYLKDSDSDNHGDKEEIDQGFDPNCPKGQDCRGTSGATNTNTNTSSTTSATGEESQGLTGIGLGTTIETETSRTLTAEEKEQLKQLTPAQLRELLLSTGNITEEQLNQISDEDLLQAVQESLGGE